MTDYSSVTLTAPNPLPEASTYSMNYLLWSGYASLGGFTRHRLVGVKLLTVFHPRIL